MRILNTVAIALVLGLVGCQGCGGTTAESESARLRDKFADQDLRYGGHPEPTEEEKSIMTKGVASIAETTNENDWVSHAELVHPILLKTDSSKQALIDMASRYTEMGWMNTYEKWEIQDFSPFVPYTGGSASLINVDAQVKVWFTDEWKGRPENFFNTIKDNYPMQDVIWNDVDSTYLVKGNQVVVAMREDSSDTYYYIQRKALQDADIIGLFEPSDMQILASYER